MWRGWTTAWGIIHAFQEGRVRTPGDLSAVRSLVGQASPEQKKFLEDKLRPFLKPYGRKVIFGKSPRMGALG